MTHEVKLTIEIRLTRTVFVPSPIEKKKKTLKIPDKQKQTNCASRFIELP